MVSVVHFRDYALSSTTFIQYYALSCTTFIQYYALSSTTFIQYYALSSTTFIQYYALCQGYPTQCLCRGGTNFLLPSRTNAIDMSARGITPQILLKAVCNLVHFGHVRHILYHFNSRYNTYQPFWPTLNTVHSTAAITPKNPFDLLLTQSTQQPL